ncbi:MAG TPA: SDR family oxidoreductase [bacterium]|nr:SDR family oxidoreductase [bacterium]
MKRLDGKVAVVTGSSSGIGAGIAGGFAAEGATVVLAARRADRLQTIAEQITNRGGVAIPVPTDLTSETQVDQLFSTTVERCGRLDILVNNAGAEVRAPIEELAVEDWDRVMAVNLRAAFLCTRHAMRIMKRQGGGRIINIGSIAAQRVRPDNVAYNVSKFGLDGLTQATALEGRSHGVVCSILHPGNTRSEMMTDSHPDAAEPMMEVEVLVQVAVLMATLPAKVNMFQAIVLPVGMPYLGRG